MRSVERLKPRVALVFTAVAVLGFALGTVGYHERGTAQTPIGWEDAAFRSLQLLFLGYDTNVDPPGLKLRIARWMLASVGIALLGVIVFVVVAGRHMRQRIASLQLRNHVIVAAEGDWLLRIVSSLRDGDGALHESTAIAILTRDADTAAHIERTYRGVSVWSGTLEDRAVVRWLRLDRASHAVIAMGDDPTSIRSALFVRSAAAAITRRAQLGILTLIRSPSLARALTAQGLSRTEESVALEFLSPLEVGVALSVRDMNFAENWRLGSSGQQLILVGANDLSEEILLRLSAAWRSARTAGERLAVDLVDEAAPEFLRSIGSRYRQLSSFVNAQPRSKYALADLILAHSAHVLVAGGDDPQSLSTAIEATVLSRDDQRVELFVTGRGLDLDVPENGEGTLWGLGIQVLERRAFSPNVLLNSRRETLARRIHEEFVKENRVKQTVSAVADAFGRWNAASDYDRSSSRAAADRMVRILLQLGYSVVPDQWVTPHDDLPVIDGDDLRAGAIMEHEYWCAFMAAEGYRYGPRDAQKKLHPQLKPFDDLDEENQDKDRQNVAKAPRLLAEVGVRVLEKPQ